MFEKYVKFRFQCPIIKFYGTQLYAFTYLLSVDAFMLISGIVVAKETI